MAGKNERLDEKLAICVGLGMTSQEAADFCGVSRQTYYNRCEALPFAEIRAFTQAAAEKTLALRIAATKSAQTAEEKIVSRLDSALQITDKVIAALTADDAKGRCEECGRLEPAMLKELMAGQKAITQWVSKFAASEAPKRLQVEGTVVHQHEVCDELVQRLEAVIAKETLMLGAADAIEAEVVQ